MTVDTPNLPNQVFVQKPVIKFIHLFEATYIARFSIAVPIHDTSFLSHTFNI